MVHQAFDPHGNDRHTLIAAVDVDGFIFNATELIPRQTGPGDMDPTHGTVDTERFLLYITEHLLPVLCKHVNNEPRSVVVMDNASIHKDDRVRTAIESLGAILVYLPPYTPGYNPIETAFGQYKAKRKRLREQDTAWHI